MPVLNILSPNNNDTITDPIFRVAIETSAKRNVSLVEYYINGNLLAAVASAPFNLEKDISFLNNGFHNLKVKACDDAGNCRIKELEFNLNLENNTGDKNLSLSFVEPSSSGLALSNIDFPFTIKLSVINYAMANQINFYYKTESGEINLLSAVQPVETDYPSVLWDKIPLSGTYKIYAEAISWTKEKISTPEIIIIVNNINKENPEKKATKSN